MDLAASVQKVTEDIIIKIAENISNETGEKNLCLAGGVALNCVANGILQRKKIFENIWIQPASGDAGGALGAALSSYYLMHKKERIISPRKDSMKGALLGPEFNDEEINNELINCGAISKRFSDKELIEKVAVTLTEEKAIGWMQGRMEFGPRALGSRSIIADPRSPKMQKQLNLKVKYRESFRPFAPSVLIEYLEEWFKQKVESPYMLLVANILQSRRRSMTVKEEMLFGIDKLNVSRSSVPAITHIDYSARIQTVHADTNPRYHALISKFNDMTGCPMVVNTSFNIRGEPIVCTPTDAFRCFMGTDLDVLVIGNYFLSKKDQDESLKKKYQDEYALD
jgi:carbamoyltransferase